MTANEGKDLVVFYFSFPISKNKITATCFTAFSIFFMDIAEC